MRLVILKKARKMPIGTVSRGYKKVAEGKWLPVSKEKVRKPKGYSKQAAPNVYVSTAEEFPSFASLSKDTVVAFIERHTGDDVKSIKSNIKKKSGWYIWKETEDIYHD
jgi:hypothetical protein